MKSCIREDDCRHGVDKYHQLVGSTTTSLMAGLSLQCLRGKFSLGQWLAERYVFFVSIQLFETLL